MLELTTTRHNPLIDPTLHVWGWEIPVYLFLGGMVAGMMVFAGMAMLKTARGEDTRNFFSLQTPLLAFMLLNIGMGALLLDLTHKLYVWRIYLTFQVSSPMSWGSWVLLIVYATRHQGREALMTTTVDGRIKTRLASAEGDIREPDWGPFPR